MKKLYKYLVALGATFFLNYNLVSAGKPEVSVSPYVTPADVNIIEPLNQTKDLERSEVIRSTGNDESSCKSKGLIIAGPDAPSNFANPYSLVDFPSRVGIGGRNLDLHPSGKGYSLEYLVTSPNKILDQYEQHLAQCTDPSCNLSTALKRNVSYLRAIVDSGSDYDSLKEALKDGVISSQEVKNISPGDYGYIVKLVNNKTGEVEDAVRGILRILPYEKEQDLISTATTSVDSTVDINPASLNSIKKMNNDEEHNKCISKWTVNAATRIYSGTVAPELSISRSITNTWDLGAYCSIDEPKVTNTSVDSIIGELSPEGTQGISIINRDCIENSRYSVGPSVSYSTNKWTVSFYGGITGKEKTLTETRNNIMYHNGIPADQDKDVYMSRTTSKVGEFGSSFTVYPLKWLGVNFGGGKSGDQSFGKIGASFRF